MKVACLADLHLGYHKSDPFYWSHFLKFFDNVFLPYLEEHDIKIVLQLGDFFDNRKSLDLHTIYNTKKYILDNLKDKTIHILCGNHDVYYKDSNHINGIDLVLSEYMNIHTYSECTTIDVYGLLIDIIPWINTSNYDSTLKFINSSKSKIAITHLEVNGAMLLPGHHLTHGTDANIFAKYNKVLSGHIHFKSIYQNIHYTGIPYELNSGDEGAVRGFTILDTDTLKTKFIRNPYKIYHTIYFDENTDLYDIEEYKYGILKVIVKNINSTQDFDQYITRLSEICHSVKIVESGIKLVNTETFTDELMNSSTLELFEEYLQNSNIGDNDAIMSIVKDIYNSVL